MLDFVIKITFFMLPLMIIPVGFIHKAHHLALIVATVAVIGSQIKSRWLQLFMIWACLWQLWLFSKFTFMSDVFMRTKAWSVAESGQSDMFWLIVAAALYLGAARSKKSLSWFYDLICVVVVIQAVLALSQILGVNPVRSIADHVIPATGKGYHGGALKMWWPVGTLGNTNFLAAFIAIPITFFLRGKWRFALILLIPVLLVAKTTTAVAACFASIIIYYVKEPKLLILGAILLLVCVFSYDYYAGVSFLKGGYRGPAWSKTMAAICSSPENFLFGFGPNARNIWSSEGTLHNDWLTAWYYYGFVGISLLVGHVGSMIRFAWHRNRELLGAIVAMCLVAFGSLPMHLAPSGFLILIIMGLVERERLLCPQNHIQLPGFLRAKPFQSLKKRLWLS